MKVILKAFNLEGQEETPKASMRETIFAKYSASPHGSVTWQYDKVLFGD